MPRRLEQSVFAIALALCLASTAHATVEPLPTGAFAVTRRITVPGTPTATYDAMTGDISGWWDHTFSQNPSLLRIEARPGGFFLEEFGDPQNGVVHATVIYADRGRMIRFQGPLGLQGNAMDLVTTWSYEAHGDSTVVTCVCRGAGQIDENWPGVIDRLWEHFLEERFKPFIEGRLETKSERDEG